MILLPSVVRTGERLLLLLVVRSKPGGVRVQKRGWRGVCGVCEQDGNCGRAWNEEEFLMV